MNLATVAAGVFLTTGISSYAILEYQETFKAVKEVQYEPLEDVEEGMNIRDAIDVVRRNNIKRKSLILNLNNTLQDSLVEKKE